MIGNGNPQLPPSGNNNPRGGNNSPNINNQINWIESDDVYKPIPKPINEFIAERNIHIQNSFNPPQVYIKQDALAHLKIHLESNTRVEQGGILFGNAYQDTSGKIYVEITVAVPAPATIGTPAHLEFTSNSWLKIMDYAQRSHPQENIVGWYHSHPNIGVFMSGTDMNTQRSFFYHTWCLSIVYDPVRYQIGYFLGANANPIEPAFFGANIMGSGTSGLTTNPLAGSPQSGVSRTSTQQIPTPSVSTPEPQTPSTEEEQNSSTGLLSLLQQPEKLVLMIVIVLILIWVGNVIFSKLQNITVKPEDISNPIAKQTNTFKAEIKTLPKAVFTYLEKEKNSSLFTAKIIFIEPTEKKNFNGEQITTLVIALEGGVKFTDIKLEVEKLTAKEPLTTKEIFSYKPSTYGEIKTLPLLSIDNDFSQGKGVIIPLYSSKNIPAITADQQKSPPDKVKDKNPEIVYYIPCKIIYTDSEQKQKEIVIKDILKND